MSGYTIAAILLILGGVLVLLGMVWTAGKEAEEELDHMSEEWVRKYRKDHGYD